MDWGIARRVDHTPGASKPPLGATAEPAAPETGLVGTPSYMAPEQALGGSCDERTDVFLVGGLIYHLLARRAPYTSDNVWASVNFAQTATCTSLFTLVPHAAPVLVRIVERAMALDPAARYPTIEALRTDLLGFVRGNGVFSTLVVPRGHVIVQEGAEADAAYIIETGRLEVYQGEGRERQVLRTMGPGEVFGEMAILSPGPRTASVVALEDSVLRVVTAAALEEEMRGLKPWMSAFVRTLAQRFRERETGR
jgi:serine/threonine-protein kinase